MNNLQIVIEGTSRVHDIDIPNIYGGFGPKQKSITDKTIAELHGIKEGPKEIRKSINRNIKQFEEGIDYIDFKRGDFITTLLDLGYAKQSITQAKNIYLLSERGYMKLIKIMDTQLAWDIYNELLETYFYLREKEEFVINCEAQDRIPNGFNYKEIERFIDDNPEAITEFEIDDFTPFVPAGRYPKQLVRLVLETTDNELNKALKDYENKTIAVKKKDNIKLLLEDNDIPYKEIPNNFVIYDKKYSNSSMTLYTEEEVVTIILSIPNNEKAQQIRTNLLQRNLIGILPINNVTLTEKEKELTALCKEQEYTINELRDEIRETRKLNESLNESNKSLNETISKFETREQDAYEKGFEEGLKQAKKENSLFNRLKKWAKNKFGGDTVETIEEAIEEEQKPEVYEYPDTSSNRSRPESVPEVKDLGKFIPVPSEDKPKNWAELRKPMRNLVNRVAAIQNKEPQEVWRELHQLVSTKYRNGRPIPRTVRPGYKSSQVNSYTREELEFATEYCNEIISLNYAE